MFNRNGELGRIVSIAISLSRWHVENRRKTGGWREQTGAGGEVGGGAGVGGGGKEGDRISIAISIRWWETGDHRWM